MKTDSIPTRHRENDARRRFDPTHSETDLRQMDVSSISGLTEAQKAEIASYEGDYRSRKRGGI